MKVIVSGGRDYNNKKLVFFALNKLHEKENIALLVVGDATGADALATLWARENNVPFKVYEALWDLEGKRAGPNRNKKMIESNLDAKFLVAFPGGRGTKNAVSLAKKNKITTIVF